MSTKGAPLARRASGQIEDNGDLRRVVLMTLGTSALYYAAQAVLSQVLSPFDSSHLVESGSPTLRWDALHFMGIAKAGYQYEQQLAFQPGWQGILHLLHRSGTDLVGAAAVNTVARVGANVALFKLTDGLHGRHMARLTSLLYAFPPAPAVLAAPYTETLYACLTFTGLFFMYAKRYILSALAFALATTLRSTGIFASLFYATTFIGPVIAQPLLYGHAWPTMIKKYAQFASLSAIVVAPFLAFQAYTYHSLCVPEPTRPWCTNTIPLSYSFVQREYWNVGPFRYWRPEQIPNFLLAAPVLSVIIYGSVRTLRNSCGNSLDLAINLHSLLMAGLLLFASHTQIALRLAPTDPVLWWTLARALIETKGESRLAKYWVWWVCIWSAVSLALWAGHYPPA